MTDIPIHRPTVREYNWDGKFPPVGSIIWCSYWRYVYRVVELTNYGAPMTVELIQSDLNRVEYRRDSTAQTAHKVGSVWSHSTPLDRKDRVIWCPPQYRPHHMRNR